MKSVLYLPFIKKGARRFDVGLKKYHTKDYGLHIKNPGCIGCINSINQRQNKINFKNYIIEI